MVKLEQENKIIIKEKQVLFILSILISNYLTKNKKFMKVGYKRLKIRKLLLFIKNIKN